MNDVVPEVQIWGVQEQGRLWEQPEKLHRCQREVIYHHVCTKSYEYQIREWMMLLRPTECFIIIITLHFSRYTPPIEDHGNTLGIPNI